jgi:hypothetical protein
MADFCTVMTVVPAGRNVTVPLLGCGPAVWTDFGRDDDFAPAVFLADADAEACAAVLDPATVAWVVVDAVPEADFDEVDEPPHAASSSTSDPSPVAVAHPLLRMTPLFHKNDPCRALTGRAEKPKNALRPSR